MLKEIIDLEAVALPARFVTLGGEIVTIFEKRAYGQGFKGQRQHTSGWNWWHSDGIFGGAGHEHHDHNLAYQIDKKSTGLELRERFFAEV